MAAFHMQAAYRVACAPRANAFLQALSDPDFQLLEPFLRGFQYDSGKELYPGETVRGSIYFPLTMVTAISLRSHRSAIGLVGKEGLVGWPALLRREPQPQQATVLLDGGTGVSICAEHMRRACEVSPTLALSVLNFVGSYTEQICLTSIGNTSSTLKQRLCAWLLLIHDRIDGDLIRITHRLLASQLGVRRASVTDLLHVLESDAAVHCDRNLISVRKRPLLETLAGNGYCAGQGLEEIAVVPRKAVLKQRLAVGVTHGSPAAHHP